jgi:hypothetical protein
VSGTSLEAASNDKGRKYEEILGLIGLIQGLVLKDCTDLSCTIISWREVWSRDSDGKFSKYLRVNVRNL